MSKTKKRSHENISMDRIQESVSSNEDILYCEICQVKLPSKIFMKQHLLGQKHKKLYNAEEPKSIEKKCGLFVRGFPPNFTEDAIFNYFLKYGKVIWIHFGKGFVFVDFSKPSAAHDFIKEKHSITNRVLMVQYREVKQGQSKKPGENETLSIINSLKNVTTFEDQVSTLIQNIKPPAQWQFPKYQQICAELYHILSPAFPYCQIHPFGSTITGLNFQNSDVDVFISGVKNNDEDDVPYLYKTKRLLTFSQRFSKLIVIRHAKIPILRCVHIPTGISCDINLKNMLGVCNSQLINYFLNIDPKIKSLMMVLKYWARMHGITGQSNLFSNYSLTMMLIFFLQHHPYDIPSVLSLQQNPYTSNFHGGWNGGFEAIPFYNDLLINAPLLKMLEGFFNFYAEFDYGINIICPYLGGAIKKDLFATPDLLPDCFSGYKEYIRYAPPLKVDTCICIQDPFEHCRNTTPIITVSILNTFVSFCRLGKKLCTEKTTDLLQCILMQKPQNLKSAVIIESQFTQFFISMQPSLKYIESKYENTSDRQNAWFDSVVEFSTIVLKDVLKFEICGQNTLPSSSKNRRVDGQSDVHVAKETDGKSYLCSGKLNFWQGRKAVKNNIPEDSQNKSTIIEKQIALTNELITVCGDVSQMTEIVNFEITFEFNSEPPGVVIRLNKHTAHKNLFKSLATFLTVNLPLWFNIYEREQNSSSQVIDV